jgi:ribose-phosphate pyrophosphokinase
VELIPRKRLALYTGRAHPQLAEEIAEHLGVELGDAHLKNYPNGEIHCRYDESIRGSDVFIIQTHAPPVNDSLMEQLIMIDAAKRASAKRVTAVCPRYAYARQDRKVEGREPITAKLVADMFHAAGADRIISVDLHSGQIQGFFDGPVDHLRGWPLLESYLAECCDTDNLTVVSPDTGGLKDAERFARHVHADIASIFKKRAHGAVEALGLMNEEVVRGRLCVLFDDEIDTAGTVCAAADVLLDNGATDVWAAATHGVLSDPAIDRLKNSSISKVVITNTLPLPSDKQIDKIEVLSVAKIIATGLEAVFEDTSVSEIFGGENQS